MNRNLSSEGRGEQTIGSESSCKKSISEVAVIVQAGDESGPNTWELSDGALSVQHRVLTRGLSFVF